MRKSKNVIVNKITGDKYIIKEIRVKDSLGDEFSMPIEFAERNFIQEKEYNKEHIKPIIKILKNRL